ncbi:ketopantoate reductase family protein [Cohnella sp. WQ 127256]|uniref:ketopantoate reductase family protein n=1 Tax=Cohnella sp. WQ 127256 TaxID=2938790 RepID=UPI0021196B97|nr:2-dehydropantoate 2-reductase [Cohnella sp. WQ 127256]
MNKVAVLGGGSLGLLLASKLKASGNDCVLWTRTRSQASLLNNNGLTLENQAGERVSRVTMTALAFEDVHSCEDRIVLLAVKQTALTQAFIDHLSRIIPVQGTLVLFQNGIGHQELLQQALPGRTLIVAVTTEGALRIDETAVRHTGSGETQIAEDDQIDRDQLQSVKRMLEQAGFSVLLSKQLRTAILRKLLINAVINPLTAILRIRNGELTQSVDRMELMNALFHETFDILKEYGLGEESELWNTVLQVCSATSRNESSMLQDVSAHKQTEVEFINGAICRMAAKQGKDAPWNKAVTALVRAIQ